MQRWGVPGKQLIRWFLVVLLCSPAVARGEGAARARSIGHPNQGRLEGGRELEASERIALIAAHHWGLPALVAMLEHAASRVATKHDKSVLIVGDLSAKAGGPIRGHDSHESGRDADVGFYLRKGGAPFVAPTYLVIDETGMARGARAVSFDDQRNWALVEALLRFEGASVQQIFVANHLRKRLLAEGRRSGADRRILKRAALVMSQPRGTQPHADHFHVRIQCPRGQRGCFGPAAPRWKKRAKVALR